MLQGRAHEEHFPVAWQLATLVTSHSSSTSQVRCSLHHREGLVPRDRERQSSSCNPIMLCASPSPVRVLLAVRCTSVRGTRSARCPPSAAIPVTPPGSPSTAVRACFPNTVCAGRLLFSSSAGCEESNRCTVECLAAASDRCCRGKW